MIIEIVSEKRMTPPGLRQWQHYLHKRQPVVSHGSERICEFGKPSGHSVPRNDLRGRSDTPRPL